MKNVLSTLVFLAILAAIGAGLYFFTVNANKKKLATPINLKEAVPGMLAASKQLEVWEHEHWSFKIRKHIGENFAAAWANRNTKDIELFLDREFTSDIPFDSKWITKSQGTVEQKVRITGEEEVDTGDPQQFTEFLYDAIFGFKIDQYDFQILEFEKSKDLLQCKVLLEGSGSDENGKYISYRNFADVVLRPANTPAEQKIAPAVLLSWNTRKEVSKTIAGSLMREVTKDLTLNRLDLPDNWTLDHGTPVVHSFQMAVEDFDLDGDYDISIMTSASTRLVLEYVDGKYRDVTEKLGIPAQDMDPFGSSVFPTAWIDIDNDGYPDLLSGIRVFKNEGGKKFTLLKKTGLFLETEVMGVSIADYDCDGFVDVYTYYKRPYGLAKKQADDNQSMGDPDWINENETGKPNRLYKNLGDGTFKHVTDLSDSSGGYRHTMSTAWMFHNDDHYPDLYLVNYIGPDSLLVSSEEGKFFVDQAEKLACCQVGKNTGIATGDYNNDGRPDLFFTGSHSSAGTRMLKTLNEQDYGDSVFKKLQSSGAGNTMFLSQGENYSDVSNSFNAQRSGWAWGASSSDLDSDGWLDLYATAGFMSFDRSKEDGLPSFWKTVATHPENKSLKLREIGNVDREAGEVWMKTPINFDSIKTNLGSFQPNSLFLNLQDGTFADASFASPIIDGDSRNVVSVDFDRNGSTDLIVGSAGGGPLRVLSNQMKQGNRMEVRLKGVESNSLGIGSRITAEFGDQKIVRDLFPQNGFMGTGPANVWLGLGTNKTIDKLTIRWPTGKSQVFENVEANRSVRIEEGNSEIETIDTWK